MNIEKKTLIELIYMIDLIADRLAYHTKAIVVKTDKIIEIAGLRVLNDYDKHENAVCAIVTDTEGIKYPIGEIMPYLRSLNKMTPGEMERFLHYQRLGNRDEMEYFYKQVHLDNKNYIKNGYALEYDETSVGGYETNL